MRLVDTDLRDIVQSTGLGRQIFEDCEKLEILDETLIEAGFYYNGEVWMSNEVEPVPDPKIRYLGTPFEQTPGQPVE